VKIKDLKTFVLGNLAPHFGGRYFIFLKLITDDRIEGVGKVYCATFIPHIIVKMIEDNLHWKFRIFWLCE
jgi:galactonate dehydratase